MVFILFLLFITAAFLGCNKSALWFQIHLLSASKTNCTSTTFLENTLGSWRFASAALHFPGPLVFFAKTQIGIQNKLMCHGRASAAVIGGECCDGAWWSCLYVITYSLVMSNQVEFNRQGLANILLTCSYFNVKTSVFVL